MRVKWKSERFGVATERVELKVLGEGDQPGTFEAYVSVFNTPDRPDFFGDSDVMDPGAFTQTLQEKGLPPIVWSHLWEVPPIGHSLSAVEDERGLRIKGRLFLEDEGISGQYAKSVYTGMTSSPPVVKEFSFAFEAQEWFDEKKDGRYVRHLKRVELFEVGPVLVGRHPDTELIGAKSAGPARVTVDVAAAWQAAMKGSEEYLRAQYDQIRVKAGARNATKDLERLNEIVAHAGSIQELARENGADA